MGTRPTLECLLLGLLDQAPRSGYDLRKAFSATPVRRFSDSPGAIYPALRRLEREGLLAPVEAPVSGRRRRVLRLTEAGRRAFRAWLRQPPTREDVVRGLADVKARFAFMSQGLSRAQIAGFLRRLAAELDAYLGELERYRAEAPPASLTGRLAFDEGIQEYRAYARWTRLALARVSAEGRKR